MMLFSIVAACLVATALAHEGHDHSIADMDKIQLTIYYESLCPDSIKFFKEQLSPTYNSLKNYLSLDFVPFGKATQTVTNTSYSFVCHHGETECYGNIVQACVVKTYHGDDIYKVINCLMTEVKRESVTNATYPTAMCVKKFDLQQKNLDDCIYGPEGLRDLSEMGNITARLSPNLNNVPSVKVNMNFDRSESKAAVENLRNFVCKKLQDSKKNVKECSGSGVITSSVLLLALSSLFRGFISS